MNECTRCLTLLLLSPLQGSFLTIPQRVVHADACMFVQCSLPVISYLSVHLSQPASSPATSQPTSTNLLLGQQPSRGYFFCFLSSPFSSFFFHFYPYALCYLPLFFAIFLHLNMSVFTPSFLIMSQPPVCLSPLSLLLTLMSSRAGQSNGFMG